MTPKKITRVCLSRDRAICVLAGDVEGVKKIEAQEIELHNNFALGK
jgi:hypothetical protein